MTDTLRFEVKDRIGTITLNRPEKLNAFTADMLTAWVAALEECRASDGVHVVVLTGAGRGFCTGGDVGGMGEAADPSPLETKTRLWDQIERVPKTLQTLDKPVIAAVNGVATGAGMDMALMCDLRFAAESARFAETYVRMGLVPGAGGAYFLPRLVGPAKALELFWSGEFVDAREAERLGLVNRVFPDADLMPKTYEFAERVASGPPLSIRLIKRLLYQSLRTDLVTSLDLVSSHMTIVRASDDHKEAVRAFKEKRPAKFEGR